MSWFSDIFSGGGTPPPAPATPDYSPLISSLTTQANEDYNLQKEQFDWAKQTYADNKQYTDKFNAATADTAEFNLDNAQKDRARYETLFQPLQDQLVNDANTYANANNMDRMRGRAIADVSTQFDATRNNSIRDLESYGINPSATRYAGLDIGVRTQEAATKAAAAEQSDLQTEATGRALRSEALQIGNYQPGIVAQETSSGVGAGTAGVNSALSTTASGANTMGTPTQYASLGNASTAGAVGALNTGFSNTLASDNYALNVNKYNQTNSSGLGTALGMGAALMFAAEGGEVPDRVPTSASPSGGRQVDDVPARLTPGEFVFPKDVVSWYGEDKLQKLIQKAREAKGGGKGPPAKPQMRSAMAAPPTYVSPGARSAMQLPPR